MSPSKSARTTALGGIRGSLCGSFVARGGFFTAKVARGEAGGRERARGSVSPGTVTHIRLLVATLMAGATFGAAVACTRAAAPPTPRPQLRTHPFVPDAGALRAKLPE